MGRRHLVSVPLYRAKKQTMQHSYVSSCYLYAFAILFVLFGIGQEKSYDVALEQQSTIETQHEESSTKKLRRSLSDTFRTRDRLPVGTGMEEHERVNYDILDNDEVDAMAYFNKGVNGNNQVGGTALLGLSHEERIKKYSSRLISDTSRKIDSPLPREHPSNVSLSVFWINLDSSTERRSKMLSSIQRLSSISGISLNFRRIPAIDAELARSYVLNRRFAADGVTIVSSDDEPNWIKHRRNEYTLSEVACLLSHLSTISEAYLGGHDAVLIIEDDVVLNDVFFENYEAYIQAAPPSWTILQWWTNNEAVCQQNLLVEDPWISWQPDHYSTAAYTVNRRGMEAILNGTNFSLEGIHLWHIQEHSMVVADEVLFYFAKNAYTSTFPLLGTADDIQSTMGAGHSEIHVEHVATPPYRPSTIRNETILVLSSCRLTNVDDIMEEIERIHDDAVYLSSLHEDTQWIIYFVIVDVGTFPFFVEQLSRLPSNVAIQVKQTPTRFNKFLLIAEAQEYLSKYDYILMKDNDMRISGFPWNTFMNRKANAIVSGPLHQSTEESLSRNWGKSKRQPYQFHESEMWKKIRVPEYLEIHPLPTIFVEQAFVLMKGDFAAWFFHQVLVPDFLEQPFDWGIDHMWCPAANEYMLHQESFPSSGQNACTIVPVVVLHQDTCQLSSIPGGNEGLLKVAGIFNQHLLFKKWLQKSVGWDKMLTAEADVNEVLSRCRFLPIPPHNLTECAERFTSS